MYTGKMNRIKRQKQKTQTEAKHDWGRGVILRCLGAVNHRRELDGLLQSIVQSEKLNGNRAVIYSAANKHRLNLRNKATGGRYSPDKYVTNMNQKNQLLQKKKSKILLHHITPISFDEVSHFVLVECRQLILFLALSFTPIWKGMHLSLTAAAIGGAATLPC